MPWKGFYHCVVLCQSIMDSLSYMSCVDERYYTAEDGRCCDIAGLGYNREAICMRLKSLTATFLALDVPCFVLCSVQGTNPYCYRSAQQPRGRCTTSHCACLHSQDAVLKLPIGSLAFTAGVRCCCSIEYRSVGTRSLVITSRLRPSTVR